MATHCEGVPRATPAAPPPSPRFALNHRVQPGDRTIGIDALRVAEEDLQSSLVGVACVVGTQRVPPGGAQQRVRVVGDGGEDEVLGRRLRRPVASCPVSQHPCFASVALEWSYVTNKATVSACSPPSLGWISVGIPKTAQLAAG